MRTHFVIALSYSTRPFYSPSPLRERAGVRGNLRVKHACRGKDVPHPQPLSRGERGAFAENRKALVLDAGVGNLVPRAPVIASVAWQP